MLGKFMLTLIFLSVLAGAILSGIDAYHFLAAHNPVKKYFTEKTVSASDMANQPTTEPIKEQVTSLGTIASGTAEMASSSVSIAFATTTVGASSSQPLPVAKSAEAKKGAVTKTKKIPPSLFPISAGVIAKSWSSNSWGTNFATIDKEKVLSLSYQSPWAALSLYSNGLELIGINSIRISYQLPTENPTNPDKLFLSFYQGTNRLGAVKLAPYATATAAGYVAEIPFSDMSLKANYVTDILLESELPSTLLLSGIEFSGAVVPSKIQSVAPAETIVPTEEVLVPVTDPRVYFAGFQNGWVASARRATIDIKNDERSITGTAVKTIFDTTSSALSLFNLRGYQVGTNSYIRMSVFGGITDYRWQQLYVTFYDRAGNKLATTDVAAFSGKGQLLNQTWNQFEIPFAVLGIINKTIATIDIENASVTDSGDSLWIDAIEFGNY